MGSSLSCAQQEVKSLLYGTRYSTGTWIDVPYLGFIQKPEMIDTTIEVRYSNYVLKKILSQVSNMPLTYYLFSLIEKLIGFRRQH